MAGQATVLSADGGQVSVPSSGLYTAAAIQQMQSFLNAAGPTREITWDGTGTVPSPPTGSPPDSYVLEILNGANFGSVSIPSGYGAVMFGQGSSGSVTGGDANTTILSAGSITYSGNAGEIVESATIPGTTANIVDNASNATFDLGGGSYTLRAAGDGDTIRADSSALSAIVASGNGDVIQLGDPQQPVIQATFLRGESLPAATGTNLRLAGTGDAVTINGVGNVVGDAGGSTTITGMSGSSTIFAAANDVYFGAAAVTEFISSTGAQTVFGGTGNDTVFNTQGGSTVYNQGSGANSIFVAAGAGNSTINGNGAGAVFAGGGHTVLNLNNGNDQFVGGNGGSDSVYGGSVTATIFGGSNETVALVGSHSAFEVALGSNTALDGSLSSGNNFFAISTTGNTTLVGSNSGSSVDIFALDSVAGGSAHTITIENWHSGDGFFLNGYNAGDIQTMDTALNGGASSFTLSDGTTVTFQGNHPMHATGAAGY